MIEDEFEELSELCVNAQGRLVVDVQDFTEIIGVHEYMGELLFTI